MPVHHSGETQRRAPGAGGAGRVSLNRPPEYPGFGNGERDGLTPGADLAIAEAEVSRLAAAIEKCQAELDRVPVPRTQLMRDRLRRSRELATLQVQVLRRELAEGEAVERQAEADRILAEHGDAQAEVGEIERDLRKYLSGIEGALDRIGAVRQATRRRNHALRSLGHEGGLQVVHRPDRDWLRRLESLPRQYKRLCFPLMY